jgi:hypothetical protein
LQGQLWLAMLGDRLFQAGDWATTLFSNLF